MSDISSPRNVCSRLCDPYGDHQVGCNGNRDLIRRHDSSSPCNVCSRLCDPYGDHQVGCNGNRDLIRRHDSLRDILFSAAQSAGLAPVREVPSLIPNSSSRPAYIFFPLWKGGKPAALDVTVISSLQSSTVAEAAFTQGAALGVADLRKQSRHSAACSRSGVSFFSIAVEVLGGWSSSAAFVISSIGRYLGQRLDQDSGESSTHLFQWLSVALWRGNAAMWATRRAPLPPVVDGLI